MALITRVSRLFRADVNAVIDRLEEPEILLKQAVREMEEALAQDQQREKLIALEIKQIAARQTALSQALKEMDEEMDLCFANGSEALARTLLKRRLEAERMQKYLSHKRDERQEAEAELNKRTDENRERLESMRQKAEILAATDSKERESQPWNEADFMCRFAVTEEDIELAFLREKQKRTPA